MRYLVIFLLVFTMGLAAQETPESLREQGLAAMKAAQSDPDQIVLAAKFLAQAADGFLAAGKEIDAEEMNSCLFWAKKKMTLAQIDAYLAKGNGTAKATVAKLESVENQEVKKEDAGKWLAKADGDAEAAKDPFLAAVRYFEVASRFKGTPEGEQALEKSLKFLQQAKVAVAPSNKPIGPASRGDSKIYVQSNPTGATILVEAEDGLRDTGVKTPGMVSLPKGTVKLVLQKDKYVEGRLTVTAGDAIVKTDVVTLNPFMVSVDVTVPNEFGDGWIIFVDGKPAMDQAGKPAVAPCTIKVPLENHRIQVAKEGFVDSYPKSVTVAKGKEQAVAIEGRPAKGSSQLITPLNNSVIKYGYLVGLWRFDKDNPPSSGTWDISIKDGKLLVTEDNGNSWSDYVEVKDGLIFAWGTCAMLLKFNSEGYIVSCYSMPKAGIRKEAPSGKIWFTAKGTRLPKPNLK